MNSYEDGTDIFGYKPHHAPSYLTPAGQRIFTVVQEELVRQAKRSLNKSNSGNGEVIFRQDLHGFIDLNCQLNLTSLTEAIEAVLDPQPKQEDQMILGTN